MKRAPSSKIDIDNIPRPVVTIPESNEYKVISTNDNEPVPKAHQNFI